MHLLTVVALAVAGNFSIVPGTSIGHVKLNHDVPSSLGAPTFSDGAAGHIWSTWKSSDGNTLDTLGVIDSNSPGHLTKYVRVTSHSFKTSNGIKTGQTWHHIKAHFPSVHVTTYDSKQFSRKLAIMDDKSKGIAFEVTVNNSNHVTNSSKCKAIWVHKKHVAFDPSTWVIYEATRP